MPIGEYKANLIKVIWVCSNNQPQETHYNQFLYQGNFVIQANELREDMGQKITSKHF